MIKKRLFFVILTCSILGFTWCFGAEKQGSPKKEWQDPKYKDVLNGISNEDYEMVLELLTELSDAGDSKSLCVLATMYCFPAGTTRDYAKAYALLKQAALQDNERAEYLLGAFGSLYRMRQAFGLLFDVVVPGNSDDSFWKQCFKGNKEVISYKDAFEWFYLKDGNWGYRDIMYYAAVEFLDDSSAVYNVEKGLKWLKKSAALKYDEAIKLLQRIANTKKP